MVRRSSRPKCDIGAEPHFGGWALIALCRLQHIGHVQASAMDTGQIFLESLPVLKGVWVLAAAIQPNPRAEEPSMRMGHLNMTVGLFLVGQGNCEAVVIFSGSTLFCRSELFVFWTQTPGDILLLNEIG